MSPKPEAHKGLRAVGVWTALEFAIRGVLPFLAAGALVLSGGLSKRSPVSPTLMGALLVGPLALALIVLAVVFKRRVVREQLGFSELGYSFGRDRVIAGFCAGFVLILVSWGTSQVDVALVPEGAKRAEALVQLLAKTGPIVAVALLLANGVLAPLVEEFAWRGYIQYRLMRGWGTWPGLLATGVLFAGKHFVVDLSLDRTVTLLVGGCIVSVIRLRWGTVSTTIAHLILNLVATSYVLVTGQSP